MKLSAFNHTQRAVISCVNYFWRFRVQLSARSIFICNFVCNQRSAGKFIHNIVKAHGKLTIELQIYILHQKEHRLEFLAQLYCCPFSSVVHPLSVNFLHFHLLLENSRSDFTETWQESSLGVGNSKLFKWCLWPPWEPWGGPQGPKPCKFQTSSSPDPEVEQSSSLVCRYLLR